VTHDLTKPNGILVSPDQQTVYVAQSYSEPGRIRELRAYPIREDGTLGRTMFCTSSLRTTGAPSGASMECALTRKATSLPAPASYKTAPVR
jgi:sugar lactone lactonase YvrE